MAAGLGLLPVALTSKLEIWFLSKGLGGKNKSCDKITSHDCLLICSTPGNSPYRNAASKGMQMVDQWRSALPGHGYQRQGGLLMM